MRSLEGGGASSGLASFLWTQLTRSRLLIFAWAGAAVAAILSASEHPALAPIRFHLQVLAAAGLVFTLGALAVRYVHVRRRGAEARISRRSPALAEVGAALALALMPRGLIWGFVGLAFVVFGVSWLGAYVLQQTGDVSQGFLDTVFWAGAAAVLCFAVAAVGLRAVLQFARRALRRQREHILALTRAERDTALEAAAAVLARDFTKTSERVAAETSAALEAAAAVLTRDFTETSERLAAETSAAVASLEASLRQMKEGADQGLERNRTSFEERVASVEAGIREGVSNLAQRLEALATEHNKLAGVQKADRQQIDALESSGFHVVQRYLTQTETGRLAQRLSAVFGIDLTELNLGYIAHRVRELETRSLGRIAAPIGDVLVRIAALMAVRRRDVSVLEIGALFGIGALAMHVVCRDRFDRLSLTLLDPLSGYYDGQYGTAVADMTTGIPVTRETLEHNIRTAGVPPGDITILQFYSEDPAALAQASSETFDLLIIDGDHSFDGVIRDYADYAPLVRKNGFVIFDDYAVPEWSGVTAAADRILGDRASGVEKVALIGKTLVCRVRGKVELARASIAAGAALNPGASPS